MHEFHNLIWITEINELFHDILIYWDAPVYKKNIPTFPEFGLPVCCKRNHLDALLLFLKKTLLDHFKQMNIHIKINLYS